MFRLPTTARSILDSRTIRDWSRRARRAFARRKLLGPEALESRQLFAADLVADDLFATDLVAADPIAIEPVSAEDESVPPIPDEATPIGAGDCYQRVYQWMNGAVGSEATSGGDAPGDVDADGASQWAAWKALGEDWAANSMEQLVDDLCAVVPAHGGFEMSAVLGNQVWLANGLEADWLFENLAQFVSGGAATSDLSDQHGIPNDVVFRNADTNTQGDLTTTGLDGAVGFDVDRNANVYPERNTSESIETYPSGGGFAGDSGFSGLSGGGGLPLAPDTGAGDQQSHVVPLFARDALGSVSPERRNELTLRRQDSSARGTQSFFAAASGLKPAEWSVQTDVSVRSGARLRVMGSGESESLDFRQVVAPAAGPDRARVNVARVASRLPVHSADAMSRRAVRTASPRATNESDMVLMQLMSNATPSDLGLLLPHDVEPVANPDRVAFAIRASSPGMITVAGGMGSVAGAAAAQEVSAAAYPSVPGGARPVRTAVHVESDSGVEPEHRGAVWISLLGLGGGPWVFRRRRRRRANDSA